MKYITLLALLMIACSPKEEKVENNSIKAVVAAMTLDSTNNFGAVPSLVDVEPKTLVAAISEKTLNTPVRLVSRVTNSCDKKGCWIVINDGDATVRVTFKDYAFFVPLGFKDRDVVLEGILREEEIPEETLKHYAEDEKKSQDEVDSIKGPQVQYTFEATSVVALPN